MFDDIVSYWQGADRPEIDSVFNSCFNTTRFVHRIVASHWFQLLDLQIKTLSTSDLATRNRIGDSVGEFRSTEEWKGELAYLSECLSLLGVFQRRLMWYERDMLVNLECLGFAPDGAGIDKGPAHAILQAAKRDFQAIVYQLDLHKSRADNLIGVVTDSINLRGAVRSLYDARRGLQLSIVGAIFFPITLVAAIFSMGGDYQPGLKDFWIPWAVAIPLVIILIFMIWISRRPRA